MNILLIGSGGREHALAWKINQSPLLTELYVAPGNGGTRNICTNVTLDLDDHNALIAFCRLKNIELVIVGPEAPLVAGLVDDLHLAGISVFGPRRAAAQLEGSKQFTKSICDQMNIPTAEYGHFTNATEAKAHVKARGVPIVIKADGLAAGKGVTVAMNLADALNAIDDCFSGTFGDAGAEVVVEEFLTGEEASMFFLCDGETALPFGTAQDHKRVGDGDTGPNTGGMGAYSPATVLTEKVQQCVLDEIVEPTLRGMNAAGTPFSGVLYAGLMIENEKPRLIEYNVRFGDPECQVLMMRLKSDILPVLLACAKGELSTQLVQWNNDFALTVVMASDGYPGPYKKNTIINKLPESTDKQIQIFHAGTEQRHGQLVAVGGRVLCVSATAENITSAQKAAYSAVRSVDWPEGFYRCDIGNRAIERKE